MKLLGYFEWLSTFHVVAILLSTCYAVTRCSVWLPGYYEFVVYTILGGCQAGMWLLGCLCGY